MAGGPGDFNMSCQICRCCGGRMAQSSPRNPNLCAACEQLLADDCAELERLMMAAGADAPARAPATAPRDFCPSPVNASEPQTDFAN